MSLELLRIGLNNLWTAGLILPGAIAFLATAATRRAALGLVLGVVVAFWLRTGFPLIPFGAAEHALALAILAGAVLGAGTGRLPAPWWRWAAEAAVCAAAAFAVAWPALATPFPGRMASVLVAAMAGILGHAILRRNAARPVASALVLGAVLSGFGLASLFGGSTSLVVPPIALGAAALGGALALARRGLGFGPAALLLCGTGLAGFAAAGLATTLVNWVALTPLPFCFAGLLMRGDGYGALARVAVAAAVPAIAAAALAYSLQ
ncbi:MAG: hypothetical protein O3A96_03590 [Proteobacteria bacterium]|nr:hypothetical protein [Pseudomonadota bacterium]